jgi:formylglycine-generating enzyme required for sulfatase activity
MHTVRLSQPFYLGKYEVTQGQWVAVMGTNPSHFQGNTALPVESVSWDDVQQFISRLSTRERGTAFYRLPTEAEWEYAARAGSTTVYSFGNSASDLGRYAWYQRNSSNKTHPVGQLQPNAWKLYDMHGNVWEWVQDLLGPYASGIVTDPTGFHLGETRVHRGCGFGNDARACHSAQRSGSSSGSSLSNLGFRLLMVAQ